MRKHYWKYKCTAALLMLWCAAGTLAPAEGGDLIGLSWKPDYDAVRYEVQMKDDDGMFYDNQFVYANSVLLDKKGRLEHSENVSYRVRPIDFDGNRSAHSRHTCRLKTAPSRTTATRRTRNRTEAGNRAEPCSIPSIPSSGCPAPLPMKSK